MRRRGIALSGLAMIVAGLIWAAIAWAAAAEFKVQKPSGSYVDVEVDESESNYKTYRYEGAEKDGRSLFSVLADAGIENWTSVTVEGLTVRRGEFPRSKPPLFIVRGEDDLTFYRPKSENGSAESRQGIGLMTYRVPLELTASPKGTPEAGDTVNYTARVLDGGPQSAYEFTWTPSSGSGGTGSTFKYTYPETTQEVTINVTAKRGNDNQTVGTGATSTVKIEAPPPSSSGGGSGTGGLGSGFGSGYNYSPSSPDYDYDFPDSGGSSTGLPDSKLPKTPDTAETPSLDELGTSVEGELLSATTPLPPASGDAGAPPEEEPRDPEEAIDEAKQIDAPGALIAAGVAVGLIGLGAGREMENVRPRRMRRPGLSGLRRLSPPWK